MQLRPETSDIGGGAMRPFHVANISERIITASLESGTLLEGSVRSHYRLAASYDCEPQLLTLQRLFALSRLGGFARCLHTHETKVERWIWMLCAYDLSLQGASQRDIAGELFGFDSSSEWRTRSVSLLSAGHDARGMISGGYLHLLLGSHVTEREVRRLALKRDRALLGRATLDYLWSA